MGGRYTKRARLGYWFDNLMSRGTSAKIRLLLVVTLVYILFMGLVTAVFASGEGRGPIQTLWVTMLYVIGQADPELEIGSVAYAVITTVNVLYCMFFTAILIGLITDGISAKMDQIAKGTGKVLESGHTIILGFNDATLILIEELIEANRNQPQQQCIVVLDEIDWQETTDLIRKRFGRTRSHPQTKILCRTGSIFGLDDLRRCSIEASRCVVINGDTDFDIVRSVMACAHLLGRSAEEHLPYLVSVIHGDENITESFLIAENAGVTDALVHLSLDETLARIMVHTSRHPGLSDVFTELFNYANDELYVIDDDPSFPNLYGRSIAEINLMLKTSFAVGTCREGKVTIAAPSSVVFNEGDALILVQEDDDPQVVRNEPLAVAALGVHVDMDRSPVSILVLGTRSILADVLEEYAYYLPAKSTVFVADSADAAGAVAKKGLRELYASRGISLTACGTDVSEREALYELLDECEPDSVLLLRSEDAQEPDDDARIVRVLMYLRAYRIERTVHFSITSEIGQMANKDLVAATGPDDFILSSQMAALLMAQISQRREMAEVFRVLLSSEGFEVYMRKCVRYVPTGVPLDLHTVSQAVAEKGEVFIGLRQKRGDRYERADINPSKYVSDMQTLRKYTFHDEDYLVVLADLDTAPGRQ